MRIVKTIKSNNQTINFYPFSKSNTESVRVNGIELYMEILND